MMMKFLIRALAAAAGFWIASRLFGGVTVGGLGSLIAAGLVLGLLNALVRPLLILFTLPLTLLTLGLFLLVINGVTVWLVTVFIHDIHLRGPWTAILTALVISVVSWFADRLTDAADA